MPWRCIWTDVHTAPNSSVRDETVSAPQPLPSDADLYNEEQFTEFMYVFCRFVNLPADSAQALENEDLLFLWISEAELYAQFQGKTYSGSGDEDWIYSLPEEDLKKISKLTLGFEQDFAMYENEAYFEGSSYTVHYFDPQEKMFYLGFLEPLQGINAEGFFTSFIEFSSIEIDGDELTAVCVLSDSHGLGTEAFERTVTYKFKMISQDNLTYYCFQSLQAS